MKKIPYVFDMRSGHYKWIGTSLNEGEATVNTESSSEEDSKETKASPVNLSSPEIVQLEKDKNTKIDQLERELSTKKDLIVQAKAKLEQALQSETITQAAINVMQKDILQLQYEYNNKELDKIKQSYDFDNKIIQLKQQLLNEQRKYRMPEKYRGLNESNIHTAKIYLDNLVGKTNEDSLLKDMHDFKKAFKKSELLYGKDQSGYFAVCVDKQDFEKITNTLEEVGYLRDEILDTLMPQILNRAEMVVK